MYDHFFFFNVTATTEIYTLSLHDALPIWHQDDLNVIQHPWIVVGVGATIKRRSGRDGALANIRRSEEHTSELQSHSDLVCRLLLEKKKRVTKNTTTS